VTGSVRVNKAATQHGRTFELPGHFRVSYAAADASLAEAMKRVTSACARLL
jgi:aspartate aminotransferase